MTRTSLLKQKIGTADLAYLVGGATAIISLLGWAEPVFWMFDLCSHFRVQYFFILLICGGALAIVRHRKGALVVLGMAALNAAAFLPYLGFPRPIAAGSDELTVMVANVNSANRDHERLFQVLDAENPDVLIALEINARWEHALLATTNSFPYRVIEAREDNFGIVLLSRHPVHDVEIRTFDVSGVPSIQASIGHGDAAFSVIATHPLPPGGSAYVAARNEHFRNLAISAEEIDGPLIVAGDLNTTPWNGRFKALLREGNLRHSSKGLGVAASWPANLPPMRIPIDHVLHSDDFEAVSVKVAGSIGSDHLPLTTKLVRTGKEKTPQRAGF